MGQERKKILFVDDEPQFLEVVQQLMQQYAGEAWEIGVATDAGQALTRLQEKPVDLLVMDVHMPVLDGVQFLGLLQRRYPNLRKVVLTGDATEDFRAQCLSNGADLFLEKPRDKDGWHSIYATLDELAKFQPEQGFRGVLRRVGLQDVLQMECLARNSSVLAIASSGAQGAIYIRNGQIVHAQVGEMVGVEAFNRLLALAGGEFSLRPFAEPAAQSITGSWEFLIMEAARMRDEAGPPPAEPPEGAGEFHTQFFTPSDFADAPAPAMSLEEEERTAPAGPEEELSRPQIDEVLVCSVQGDVLYEWQCGNTNGRIGFLEFVSQKARQLAQGLPLGHLDRLEMQDEAARAVAQIRADRALFVRSSRVLADAESLSAPA